MESVYDAIVIGGGPADRRSRPSSRGRAGASSCSRRKSSRASTSASRCCPTASRSSSGSASSRRSGGRAFRKKYGAFFWNDMTGRTRPVIFRDSAIQAPDGLPGQARGVRQAPSRPLRVERRGDPAGGLRRGRALRERPSGRRAHARPRRPDRGAARPRRRGRLRAGRGHVAEARPGVRCEIEARGALRALRETSDGPRTATNGDILLPIDHGVWYWIIPFSDGTASVGAVFEPAVREGRRAASRPASMADRALAPHAVAALGKPARVAGPQRLGLLVDLGPHPRGRLGDGRRRRDVSRSRLLDRRLPRARDRRARGEASIDAALARHGRLDARDLAAYER